MWVWRVWAWSYELEMSATGVVFIVLGWLACATATHYRTLGVDRKANADEIKRAYRKLALKHHPDKVPLAQQEAAAKKFKQINEAYATLSDPSARKRYDMMQAYGFDTGSSSSGGGPTGAAGVDPRYAFFGAGGGIDPRMFEEMLRQQREMRRAARGPPPRARREFFCSFDELASGTTRTFVLHDTPFSRLRDALQGNFADSYSREALYKTSVFGLSFAWRFHGLLFGRRWFWTLRFPAAVAAFLYGLSQQLPASPTGTYEFDVLPGYRDGTKIKFKGGGGGGGEQSARDTDWTPRRAVAFELRERRHTHLSRRGALSSGDLVWRAGRVSAAAALRGTEVKVTAADGAEHVVELKLTEEEAAELEERRRRVVPDAGADGTGRGARPPRRRRPRRCGWSDSSKRAAGCHGGRTPRRMAEAICT